MGHHISAVILKGPFNADLARQFDLRPEPLGLDLTLFPLDASYCDFWADGLGIPGSVTESPALNVRVIHDMIRSIARNARFAVIETDYFGGVGQQTAVVYDGKREVSPPETAHYGPINSALRSLGVQKKPGLDEFDTVGLGWHRHVDDFDWYWDLMPDR